ncbi:MAG: response regulator [Deltaproteobacteria bacterium]|nr:response regulator [Deltaproteobacteria bacterium]MBW2135011.1 response regulator [Deltaproteobacteria bacterium]
MVIDNQILSPGQNQRVRSEFKGMNFLVVDDMAAIREVLCLMLVKLGVRELIEEAGDGLEAIAKLKETQIDFIISDINMPRLNGLELHKWLRNSKKFRNIPFLMITGEVPEETVAAAIVGELDGYLLKPFQLATLEVKILELIKKKQNHAAEKISFSKA